MTLNQLCVPCRNKAFVEGADLASREIKRGWEATYHASWDKDPYGSPLDSDHRTRKSIGEEQNDRKR